MIDDLSSMGDFPARIFEIYSFVYYSMLKDDVYIKDNKKIIDDNCMDTLLLLWRYQNKYKSAGNARFMAMK